MAVQVCGGYYQGTRIDVSFGTNAPEADGFVYDGAATAAGANDTTSSLTVPTAACAFYPLASDVTSITSGSPDTCIDLSPSAMTVDLCLEASAAADSGCGAHVLFGGGSCRCVPAASNHEYTLTSGGSNVLYHFSCSNAPTDDPASELPARDLHGCLASRILRRSTSCPSIPHPVPPYMSRLCARQRPLCLRVAHPTWAATRSIRG